MVESFAGRNFSGDKLSRTQMVKIKFRGYKLSRTPQILTFFLYFHADFGKFWMKFRELVGKVQYQYLLESGRHICHHRLFLFFHHTGPVVILNVEYTQSPDVKI